VRLRYLGSAPTTFVALGLEVEPGDEFDVDDSTAPGLVGRGDIVAVDPPKTPRRKAKPDDSAQPSAPVPAGDAPDSTVTPEEVPGGVSDDH
jgi:hypothetical protein